VDASTVWIPITGVVVFYLTESYPLVLAIAWKRNIHVVAPVLTVSAILRTPPVVPLTLVLRLKLRPCCEKPARVQEAALAASVAAARTTMSQQWLIASW